MPDFKPSPTAAISKTINRMRTRGPREVVALGTGRVKEWVGSSDTLVMFVRDAEGDRVAREGLEFRSATPADAIRYAREIGTDSPTTFSARLSDATRCFLVDDGDLLLHASWVTTAAAWTRELQRHLVVPSGDAYIYESFTRAEARGRGIFPFALANIVAWAAETELRRVWIAVEEHNPPSLRAVSKAGFVEAFRVPFSRRWGRVELGRPTGRELRDVAVFMSGNVG